MSMACPPQVLALAGTRQPENHPLGASVYADALAERAGLAGEVGACSVAIGRKVKGSLYAPAGIAAYSRVDLRRPSGRGPSRSRTGPRGSLRLARSDGAQRGAAPLG